MAGTAHPLRCTLGRSDCRAKPPMSIQLALTHVTHYQFDRRVALSPHEIRLRPAPHARTPIVSYALHVEPAAHFLNWQQDPYGNWLARVVFPDTAAALKITVDLVAELTVINPFDFFVEKYAEVLPFAYPAELRKELAPFLETADQGPLYREWLSEARAVLLGAGATIHGLVALNQRLQQKIRYLVRLEPGVQTPEATLQLASGSCRDSGWLLVQTLRDLGLAARFASGYLIQLVADQKSLDGPSGTSKDFTDLHAWAEVYLPGAGWVGLDPTSGLLTGEGHIPLACTATPGSAAPVIGFTDVCQSTLDVRMSVQRLQQTPRVTAPVSDAEWAAIDALGAQVDAGLQAADVRLTMGGEPTFVSIDDLDGPEWNYTADSPRKYALACNLLKRLAGEFATGALLHYGQGKWYPGEPLPRWALSCVWRSDGLALWRDPQWLADPALAGNQGIDDAQRLGAAITRTLGLPERRLLPAYEDPLPALLAEANAPINIDPAAAGLGNAAGRHKLITQLAGGLTTPVGYVLPLDAATRLEPAAATTWRSSPWPLRRQHLFLLAGDSPLGYRLPLNALPWVLPEDLEPEFGRDAFAPREPLAGAGPPPASTATPGAERPDPREVVRKALGIELREGRLHVFLPPLVLVEDFVWLIRVVEDSARALKLPLVLEGYLPEHDPRLQRFAITPDPGVIEVNIHPSASWKELRERTLTLFAQARLARLGTDKFELDGRHTGTGGGNHLTLGGPTPADSPLLRRPDLLRSLLVYWQNHPSLSYLFSGAFIGPTSQSPRVDEARDDTLYELEIALGALDKRFSDAGIPAGGPPPGPGAEGEKPSWDSAREARVDNDVRKSDEPGPSAGAREPWMVDRILRNFLVDLTGNTHRAEFCIDKLYPPTSARFGLLEFRGFEMPPHPRMALLQALLLRALVLSFWRRPWLGRLKHHGNQLHDHFLLPHFVDADFREVIADLRAAGLPFERDWFAAFFEFRFPRLGEVQLGAMALELRQSIEPWHVLGEEMALGGTARYVDSSLERLQVRVTGFDPARWQLSCNGRQVPLTGTGTLGEYVAGVRFRAWAPVSALHPTIPVHTPLQFDLLDRWNQRSLGGMRYHVAHPGGRNYTSRPVNALEAEARRRARFFAMGHTAGPVQVRSEARNPLFPCTLDLRRAPEYDGAVPLRAAQQ